MSEPVVVANHTTKVGCSKLKVTKECCYIDFQLGDKPLQVESATSLRMETCRNELIVIDLSKDGTVLGFELIAPGLKPCQPLWTHSNENEDIEQEKKV